MKRLALIAALACAALLALASGASAATFNVTTTDDDVGTCDVTDCSLREAIDAADSNSTDDTINVPAGHYTLANGELDITASEDPGALTIIGANARSTIVDAAGNSRVFNIDFGLTVNISHLTITGGNASQGGGIFSEGNLTLDSSAVDGNTAVGDGTFGGQGGGIFNDGSHMTVTNSSVSRNIADGAGNTFSGGQGGGIFNNDAGDFTNVTVSGNQAKPATGATFPDGQGGGIFANDATTLTNVTIASNTSSGATDNAAGGIFINDQTTFKNTIVATNSVGGGENDCVVNSTFTDGGHNIEGATDCSFTGPGDQRNTNPLLGPLGDNGGESDTQALLAGSPAIDTADAARCPAADQRGVSRPQLAGCDIGAFEAQPPPPPPAPPAPPAAPPKDTTKPTVSVAGVRRACVSSSTLAIRVRASDASGVRSVRVTLDGKRLRIRSKTSFTLHIDVRKLKPGRHVLRITSTDAAGNPTTTRRTITRCAKRAAKPRRRVAPRFTG